MLHGPEIATHHVVYVPQYIIMATIRTNYHIQYLSLDYMNVFFTLEPYVDSHPEFWTLSVIRALVHPTVLYFTPVVGTPLVQNITSTLADLGWGGGFLLFSKFGRTPPFTKQTI